MSNDRGEIIKWLHWALTMTSREGRDFTPARRLLNALTDLDEGRTSALLRPAPRNAGGIPKSRREIGLDALAVASVDGLMRNGVAAAEACAMVAKVVGLPTKSIENLRKKVHAARSGGGKYAVHVPAWELATKRMTVRFGDVQTILDNLAVNLSLSGGRPLK